MRYELFIANRYLRRDYQRFNCAGIELDETLFTLDVMVVKFDQAEASDRAAVTIPELVDLARTGNEIAAELVLVAVFRY